MSSYVKRIELSASVEEVYKAITTEKDIKSWWTVPSTILEIILIEHKKKN